MKMKHKIIYFILGSITMVVLFVSLSFTFGENQNVLNLFPQEYKIVTPHVPDQLEIFGERVPLENIEVYERVEREFVVNTYWHSATVLLLKKASRWFPVIEPILKKNGIPDDFKYMAMIESNLSNVVSPAGAVGFWQFMKAAGKKYGLEINGLVDERYHVEKATEAACKYLKDSYDKYYSWTMAAGSYNMGTNGIDKQLDRQKTNNYYNLVINPETSRFVSRIIAMKEIHKNPKLYGFNIEEDEFYKPHETYTITIDDKVDHFAVWAFKNGINYKTLKYFNPWLRDNYLTNKSKKKYEIKMPLEGTFTLVEESN
jgi:membrane-bound lytic murein transglycosylase D